MTRAPSPVVALSTLRCAGCGSAAVVTVCPGSLDVVALGLLVARGVAVRGWCGGCWGRGNSTRRDNGAYRAQPPVPA